MMAPAETIRQLLSGSWRMDCASPAVTQGELAQALHVIASTGAGPLVWWRIRNSNLAGSDAAAALQMRYRAALLFAALQIEAIKRIAGILEAAGIVPLTFKGWAVAQYYSSPPLRPFGDIDLCAPPGRYAETATLLNQHSRLPAPWTSMIDETAGFTLDCELPCQVTRIDLHGHLDRFHLGPLTDVYDRSQRVCVGNAHIRTLAPEDHLRLVCLHFLRHGGWRPIWLCDVGAMLEALPEEFDWELCLGDDRTTRHWIMIVLALAQVLLDACHDAVPRRYRAIGLPRWLVATILKQWSRPFAAYMPRPRLAGVLRRPRKELWSEIGARWPDPIRATVFLNGAFDTKPRWPYQMALFGHVACSFLARQASYARHSL